MARRAVASSLLALRFTKGTAGSDSQFVLLLESLASTELSHLTDQELCSRVGLRLPTGLVYCDPQHRFELRYSRYRNKVPKPRIQLKVVSIALAVALFAVLCCGISMAAKQTAVAIPIDSVPSMDGSIDGSWSKAAKITLSFDFVYRGETAEPTTVYVMQDAGALDVAFVATQRGRITAGQHTDGSSVQNDDYVGVYLSPQGTRGFSYGFFANANGARYQTSTENSAYSPHWSAAASKTPSGYVVTMRIPFASIKSSGESEWRAQFVRMTATSGALAVWNYAANSSNIADPEFFGTISGIDRAVASANLPSQPRSRVEIYGLGQIAAASAGGNKTRFGSDLSIPIARTASLVATIYPDYSNVEKDQQTIAPSAFARQYAEVRPFFTQVGSFFNKRFICNTCATTLYTPAIQSISQGYAVEGAAGHFSFAAFDALEPFRSDDAETLNYAYENASESTSVSAQRVVTHRPSFTGDTLSLNAGYQNQHSHFLAYSNLGWDRRVTAAAAQAGDYLEIGTGYSTATALALVTYQRIGRLFVPADGFVQQPGIGGYEIFLQKQLNFSPSGPVRDLSVSAFDSRYTDSQRSLARTNSSLQVGLDFHNLITAHIHISVLGVQIFDGEFLSFDGNGGYVAYKLYTTTPSYVDYSGGPYYHGRLNAWTYSTTLPLAKRINLSLRASESGYLTRWFGEQTTRQWLERVSVDWQISKNAQFDLGLRRIVGENLPASFAPLTYGSACSLNSSLPGCLIDAENFSMAFHVLSARNELYLVYGNPNSLSTTPALFLKLIRYVGAEKGT